LLPSRWGNFRSGRRAGRKQAELIGQLRPCFARTETWQQVGKYVSALVSELSKRNRWTIARHAGDRTPDRTQRLLNRASSDTLAAMSEVRRFAANRPGGGGAARPPTGRPGDRGDEETGQEKPGDATGVKRQYMGSWLWASALTVTAAG